MKRNVVIIIISAMALMVAIVIIASTIERKAEEKAIATWEAEKIVENREIVYTKKEIESDGINSYWFVYAKERNKGVYWNEIVKFDHSYFSAYEAFEIMKKDSDKEFFLINFIEVSEATYIDYQNNTR